MYAMFSGLFDVKKSLIRTGGPDLLRHLIHIGRAAAVFVA